MITWTEPRWVGGDLLVLGRDPHADTDYVIGREWLGPAPLACCVRLYRQRPIDRRTARRFTLTRLDMLSFPNHLRGAKVVYRENLPHGVDKAEVERVVAYLIEHTEASILLDQL